MNHLDYIKNEFIESVKVKEAVLNNPKILNQINDVANLLVETYQLGGRIFLAGNGGSAADAQHLAGELVSKFYFDRKALSAIALTTDTSILTAIGNDFDYNYIFKRQLEAHATPEDVFIGITTSGNSKNIVEALKFAKEIGLKSVVFNGKDGGIISKENLGTINIVIPSPITPRIQESHLVIGHTLCAIVEKVLF